MHPILIRFTDTFFIGTYGLLIAVGLLISSFLAAWQGKRRGMVPDVFFDLTFIAVGSGFLGARIFYIFTEFEEFLANPMELILSRTGFVFLGGFLTATATCIWYIRWKKLDFWKIADILVPSLALGHAFGRLGCHLAGCCYGGVCNTGLGITVPRVELPDGQLWPNAYSDQLAGGVLADALAQRSLPVWPVQLMESACLFILAATLTVVANRPQRKGLILGLYLVAYAVIRFGLEYLRGDAERGLYFGGLLSTSQIISVFVFAAGCWVLATKGKREIYAPGGAAKSADNPEKSRREMRRKLVEKV